MITDYQDILAQCGYPTDVLTLDFESFYTTEYSLKKMPTINYITDPRFEFLGLGADFSDSAGVSFYQPTEIQEVLAGIDYDTYTVLVKHARFDITILQEKFGIVPKYIIDLEDLTRHYDSRMSHKLKDLAKLHKLKPKGETEDFKGLHYVDMTPYQRKNLAEYTITDVELETELFKIYLPKLSNPATELQLARHTLDLWLHKRFAVDLDLASKIKVQMRGKIAKAIQASGHTPKELRSKKFATWLQEALPDGEDVPMKKGKRGNIPALAKTDEACQQLLVHPEQKVRDLLIGRLAAKSWPTHIKRVGSLVSQTIANGGLLRVPLNYYPSHTGRWGGAEKINPQNLGGKGRGVENDYLIQVVKQLIQAPDGYKLGVADSAQIEARMLAWLAGQQDLLDGFARGEDVYSVFAARLFGCEVRKPTDADSPDVAVELKIKRGFGKDAILGAGYGMGATRFYNNCLANPSLRPLFDSGQYDFKFVKKLIDLYRSKYSKIPAYWDMVEKAFRRVIRFPHLEVKVGPVTFRNNHGTVEIELPSGRILYYRHCRIARMEEWKNGSIKWHHGTLWGGSICLAGYSQVLTDKGFTRLDLITKKHRVWDGEQWVAHNGVKHNGLKQVVGLNGIDMTPEHKVMTTGGWVNAKEAQGLTWAKVRAPKSNRKPWFKWKKLAMARAMQLWKRIRSIGQRPNQKEGDCGLSVLFDEGQECNTRYDGPSSILGVEVNDRQVQAPDTSGLEKLWWAEHQSLSTMERFVSKFLGRYGAKLSAWINIRQKKQRRRLRTKQLPMGNIQTASSQQAEQPASRPCEVIPRDGCGAIHTVLSTQPRLVITSVYDLMDCGLNNCFTVLDNEGHLRLVHNCENIDQAISRDLLGFWILRCEEKGLPVVLHVHDDIKTLSPGKLLTVCPKCGCKKLNTGEFGSNESGYACNEDECDWTQVDPDLTKQMEIMRSLPDWAEGLPVDVEGKLSDTL